MNASVSAHGVLATVSRSASRAEPSPALRSRVAPRLGPVGARSPVRSWPRLLAGVVRCAGVAATLAIAAVAQNSTRKLRAAPSATAAAAGSTIPWLDSVDDAVAAAKAGGKLVFWYVPTVAGSPMDRRPEIDRYLLAGPFSWPSTIRLLTDQFVPVRAVASGEWQRRLGLVRGRFIEPGWVVLDGEGKERARLQPITTFHPEWFEAPLRQLAGVPPAGFPCTPALLDAWTAYRAGDGAACERACAVVLQQNPIAEVAAEAAFLRGAVLQRSGSGAAAQAVWRQLAELHPSTSWAGKAAAEAEGHGPFARGFEDFLPLPARVLRDRDEGSRAPRGTYTEAQLWDLGVRFLLRLADGDGVLRDSIYDFGGTDSLPNVHLAVSFLAGEALLVAASRADAGRLALAPDVRAAVERELAALLAATSDDTLFAVEDRDEILWAHAYRVRLLARWHALRPASRDALAAPLRSAVAALVLLQPATGVWFHEYGNPFAIATALQALAAARAAGVPIDEPAVERGLRALMQCRTKAGAFTYNHPGRREPQATVPAAAGRMPLCELALALFGHGDSASLSAALTAAFEHHGLLAAVRKYDDHADQHGYGGFFFWFDMLGRTEALAHVTDIAARDRWRAQQKKLVLDLPEFDGCFVDSHELGRGYGTAMALLCLASADP